METREGVCVRQPAGLASLRHPAIMPNFLASSTPAELGKTSLARPLCPNCYPLGFTKSRKNKVANSADTKDREIIMSRLIDAPRDLVWEAMTKPEHVVHWWGPNGFTNTLEKLDFRVGGEWHHVMHGPDGRDYPSRSVYTAIEKPHRIEFCTGGTYKGDPKAMFEAIWTFEAVAAQTKVTIHLLFPNAQARNMAVEKIGAIEGGNQTLARLANYVIKI
jgi:uncharacterized protein YndB with AHSA1/START domain